MKLPKTNILNQVYKLFLKNESFLRAEIQIEFEKIKLHFLVINFKTSGIEDTDEEMNEKGFANGNNKEK